MEGRGVGNVGSMMVCGGLPALLLLLPALSCVRAPGSQVHAAGPEWVPSLALQLQYALRGRQGRVAKRGGNVLLSGLCCRGVSEEDWVS